MYLKHQPRHCYFFFILSIYICPFSLWREALVLRNYVSFIFMSLLLSRAQQIFDKAVSLWMGEFPNKYWGIVTTEKSNSERCPGQDSSTAEMPDGGATGSCFSFLLG